MMTRKKPRDFISVDEFWEADAHWSRYYIQDKVWVFMDEYLGGLAGERDYCRIIIHADHDSGWLYTRPLAEKAEVQTVLEDIQRPVSEKQLAALGFEPWQDYYI